jgi:hypothetical protein
MTRKLCNVLIINVAFAQNNYECYIHTTIITSSLICYVIVNINLVKKNAYNIWVAGSYDLNTRCLMGFKDENTTHNSLHFVKI